MRDKAILIQITVYDDETGTVEVQQVYNTDSTYGYEIRQLFKSLGQKFSKLMDPTDDET